MNAESPVDRTKRSASWPSWVATAIAIALFSWGVAPSLPSVLAFPIAAIAGGPLYVGLALILLGATMAAIVLPVLGLALTSKSTGLRLGVAGGGIVCTLAVIGALHVLGGAEDPLKEKPAAPANCKPATTDVSAVSRRCSEKKKDSCPDGYSCEQSWYHAEIWTCQIGCYHDCFCVDGLTCVNGTCQRDGELAP